jgi:hypothetical protein
MRPLFFPSGHAMQDQSRRPNYKNIAAEELRKVEDKARLLSQLLEGWTPGAAAGGDPELLAELYGACKTARPKVQKLIGEEDNEGLKLGKIFFIFPFSSYFIPLLRFCVCFLSYLPCRPTFGFE